MSASEHPTADLLSALYYGQLPDEQRIDTQAHVDACPQCRNKLDRLAADVETHPGSAQTEADAPTLPPQPPQGGSDQPTAVEGEYDRVDKNSGTLKTLRDYELLEVLGYGGMGTVYRARHQRLDRLVALKLLPTDRMRDQHAIARFEREMKAVGNLLHPNIVQAYDAGEFEGQHFLVMELLNGLDLGKLIQQHGPLDVADACEIMRQAALGLQHAHENGLVHRDVKPSNLMLVAGGTVKVLDLGLARLLNESGYDDLDHPCSPVGTDAPPTEIPDSSDFQSISSNLTGTNQVMGTPDYMSPEQCSDLRSVDIRSDIYSLGATLYKLLTGHAPFSGPNYDTLPKKIYGLTERPIPSIREHRTDLPDGLIDVIDRMLSKDPQQRLAAPLEVAQALMPLALGHNLTRYVASTGASPIAVANITPAAAHTPTVAQSRVKTKARTGLSRPQWLLIAATMAAVILGALLYLQRSPRGILVVEVPFEGADILQVVAQRGDDKFVTIDNTNEWRAELGIGTWRVHLNDESRRYALKQNKVTLHNAETSTVRIVARASDAATRPAQIAPVEQVVISKYRLTSPDVAGADAAWMFNVIWQDSLGDVETSVDESSGPSNVVRALADELMPQPHPLRPYVAVDGTTEAYLYESQSAAPTDDAPGELAIVVRAPADQPVEGSLYLPDSEIGNYRIIPFQLTADRAADDARTLFYLAKRNHYAALLADRIPGAAWFRHQLNHADDTAQGTTAMRIARETFLAMNNAAALAPIALQPAAVLANQPGVESTLEIHSDGVWLSEHMAMDRFVTAATVRQPTVELASLPPINASNFDWASLTQDLRPQADTLAQSIPADQYAIFFPSFAGLVDTVDRVWSMGTPVLRILEPRSEDAQTLQKYQTQLGLHLNTLARNLGSHLVRSVAVTGGDPYLRSGSDLAILFEPTDLAALSELLAAQIALSASNAPAVLRTEGEIAGVPYVAHISEDGSRRISSYRAVVGDVVVVSNSLPLLDRLMDVQRNRSQSLVETSEYRFFRSKLPLDDASETGLLVVSESAIDRWCSPRWRIGASRRLRAAAVLADIQAYYADAVANDEVATQQVDDPAIVKLVGNVRVDTRGGYSPQYGSLDFLTPINELSLTHATQREAKLYRQWRGHFGTTFADYIDPIAVRFSLADNRLAAQLHVMPLTTDALVQQYVQSLSENQINAAVNDWHTQSLLQLAVAMDVDNWLNGVDRRGQFKDLPFDWLGDTVSVYVDADELWQSLQDGEGITAVNRARYRLPLAVEFEVVDRSSLDRFLDVLQQRLQISGGPLVPAMLEFTTQEFLRETIVHAELSESMQLGLGLTGAGLFYYAGADRLVITPNRRTMQRAIRRAIARRTQSEPGAPPQVRMPPLPGEHVVLALDRQLLDIAVPLAFLHVEHRMRQVSWNNLPILNEWKKRYPDRDPVEVHQQLWGRRLVCPGGGKYRYNEQYQTMESTVYGHPGQSHDGPRWAPLLERMKDLTIGLTLQDGGLQAVGTLRLNESVRNESR